MVAAGNARCTSLLAVARTVVRSVRRKPLGQCSDTPHCGATEQERLDRMYNVWHLDNRTLAWHIVARNLTVADAVARQNMTTQNKVYRAVRVGKHPVIIAGNVTAVADDAA